MSFFNKGKDVHPTVKNLLGRRVKDKVSGYTGVVISVTFDLFGCIQAIVKPEVTIKDGSQKVDEGHWFDITRLEILDTKPVMDLPDYVAEGKKGAADKPAITENPLDTHPL